MEKVEVIKEFRKYLKEYIDLSPTIDEDDNTMDEMPPMGADAQQGAPNDMGQGSPMDGGMPPQDDAMGGMPPQDDAMGSMPPQGDAMSDEASNGVENFNPQGIDPNSGIEGMGGEEQGGIDQNLGDENVPSEDDDVIEIDDLTDSQEKTEEKVEKLSHNFEKLLQSINQIVKKIEKVDSDNESNMKALKDEFEKRNPTPMQKMSMRTMKSSPYTMTTNEYMNNFAPENYSPEDDNNGADDPQYQITRDDIDNFTDYNSIAKEFEGKRTLRDIFGY